MIEDIVISIHKKVYKLFNYVSDQKNYGVNEDWRSHAEEVKKNIRFSDDCDGFALTCAELIIEEGVDREAVKIIICETETGESHLVCGVDSLNTTLICDNRFARVRDWNYMDGYKFKYFMAMNEPGQWRETN